MKSYYVLAMGRTKTVVSKTTAGKAKSIMRMHGVHTYRITNEPGLYTEITFTKNGMYMGTYFTKSHRLIHFRWSAQ